MKKIIIDTNALMAVTEFKLDLFTEIEKCCDFDYQLFVLSGTVDELQKIIEKQRSKVDHSRPPSVNRLRACSPSARVARSDPAYSKQWCSSSLTTGEYTRGIGRFKRAAKLVLSIIKAKKIAIITSQCSVDDQLVKHSLTGDLVLTQDYQLKKRLKKPYLTIRQKKYVILVR